MGVARSVEAVKRHESRPRPGPGLPVAVGHHSRIVGHVEVPAGRDRKPWEIPRIAPAEEGHLVAALKRGPRHEPVHGRDHIAAGGRARSACGGKTVSRALRVPLCLIVFVNGTRRGVA